MISVLICVNNEEQYSTVCSPTLNKTSEMLGKLGFPALQILKLEGYSNIFEAYNDGIAKSNFPIKVFMHQDVDLLSVDWVFKLLKGFAENPEYGLLGLCGTKKFQDRGFWWYSGPRYVCGQVLARKDKQHWEFNPVNGFTEVECIDGMFMATNREIEFDESLSWGFMGNYDLDICRQVKANGYKIGLIDHLCWHISNENAAPACTSSPFTKYYKKWGICKDLVALKDKYYELCKLEHLNREEVSAFLSLYQIDRVEDNIFVKPVGKLAEEVSRNMVGFLPNCWEVDNTLDATCIIVSESSDINLKITSKFRFLLTIGDELGKQFSEMPQFVWGSFYEDRENKDKVIGMRGFTLSEQGKRLLGVS